MGLTGEAPDTSGHCVGRREMENPVHLSGPQPDSSHVPLQPFTGFALVDMARSNFLIKRVFKPPPSISFFLHVI